MTDNEIIKALECCSELAGKCCCEECPLHHREDSCTTALIKKALELTNRQKAEIAALSFQLAEAKLTSDIVKQIDKEPFAEVYKAIINEQKAEIERYLHSIKLLENDVQTAKAENEKNERIIELNDKLIKTQSAEIERLQEANQKLCEAGEKLTVAREVVISEEIKEFADKVNPIIEQIIEVMFDDDHNKCMIKNCHKPSSIPCDSPTCIEENKAYWKLKIYNLVKEMVGDDNG